MIQIIFYKSSSRYYDTVCLMCENFDSYLQNKSENILNIELEEFRQKIRKIKEILEIMKNWSKTKYLIDDKEVSFRNIESFIDIFECEKRCSNCTLQNEFCFEGTGWGCKHLNSIDLRRESYYRIHWYEFGKFINDEWVIDKEKILNNIKQEISDKNVDKCEYFKMEHVESIVESLPEKILVTDEEDCEWEYKYREAPLGMKQTEIIGVKPREEKRSGFGGFGISLAGLFDNDQAQIISTRNVPLVSFNDIGGIKDIIQKIREVIELPLVAPNLFEHYHIKPHKGILLYGPPGCGKTLIAKAIANEIQAHFISVKRS